MNKEGIRRLYEKAIKAAARVIYTKSQYKIVMKRDSWTSVVLQDLDTFR